MTQITALDGVVVPNRMDPTNFSVNGDDTMARLPLFAVQANALASEVNAQQVTAVNAAATATTKAGEAASARDIALAAINYHGLWSSLSGPLAIPATVGHAGAVWLLLESVANVAAETPGVSTKWFNATPASGLGTAAYADETDFQPAIGALSGLLLGNGAGGISAATAINIISAIGAMAVANATYAANAGSAASANTVADGAISTAAKVVNGILPLSKIVNMNTSKLIGRSSSGAGSPEEIALGSRLSLVGGVLDAVASDVSSVGGNVGAITNAQLAASVISQLATVTAGSMIMFTEGDHTYAGSIFATGAAASHEAANYQVFVSGTVRVVIAIQRDGTNFSYATLYKNGVAIAGEFTASAPGVTYTQSTDVVVEPGDTLQVFQRATGGATTMLQYVDIKVTALPAMAGAAKIAIGARS